MDLLTCSSSLNMLLCEIMQITVDTSGTIPVVRLSGDMRLWGKQGLADQIRDAVNSLMTAGKKQVILNLLEVKQVDSRGIGCLARCHATSVTQRADLRLVLGPGMVLDTLNQLNFVRMCPLYLDEAAAIAAFSTPGETAPKI